jgi:hypothetical protein
VILVARTAQAIIVEFVKSYPENHPGPGGAMKVSCRRKSTKRPASEALERRVLLAFEPNPYESVPEGTDSEPSVRIDAQLGPMENEKLRDLGSNPVCIGVDTTSSVGIDSALLDLESEFQNYKGDAEAFQPSADLPVMTGGGQVLVEVIGSNTAHLSDQLLKIGMQDPFVGEFSVSGMLPIDALALISGVADATYIRAPFGITQAGIAHSRTDQSIRSDSASTNQLFHDIAPRAAFPFATACRSQAACAAALDELLG